MKTEINGYVVENIGKYAANIERPFSITRADGRYMPRLEVINIQVAREVIDKIGDLNVAAADAARRAREDVG